MEDSRKTKTQLIRELEEMRNRLAGFEGLKNPSNMSIFLQTLIDTIPSSIFYKDRQGVYRGCNRAYETFLGLKKEDIVGKVLHEIFSKDLADKYDEMDRELFEHPGRQTYEWQMSYADGTRHDVIFNKATFLNADGSVGGLIGVMDDITELKRVQEALRVSKERYRNIIENAVEGIFQSTPDGRLLNVNPAQARIFGYDSPQEMIDTFADIAQGHYVYPEDRRKFLEACDSQGFVRGFEAEFYTKTREIIWVSLNARAVRNTRGDVLFYEGFAEDITKRKRAEAELRKRENELQIKSRSLEEVNVALKFLLAQRERDKEELGNSILVNIQKMIVPYVDKLKNSPLGPKETAYVKILELSLKDMTSPFADRLSAVLLNLTSKETEVARLVKEGKSTKEIATLLNSTARAIEFHRDNIRKKLGLNKSDRNLRSYLLSLS